MTRLSVRMHLVVTAVLLGSLASACASRAHEPAASTPAISVATSRVTLGEWPSKVEAGGVLRARQTAVVSSRILAPILTVSVRAGDRVSRGQPLVVLDGAELRANAARATAALNAAELSAAAAAADERGASAALTLARTMHARITTLLAERSATTQELDEATATLAEADSRATAASARSRATAAALEAARAAAEAARIAVTYATLTAPFDGIVTDRRADPGTMAAPGSPLVIVEDPASLQLEVSLDASRAVLVKVGQPVSARVDSDASDAPWIDGCVAEISRVDPTAQAFAVKIDLPSNRAWRSGLFGRARFAGPLRQALAGPATALVRRGQLAFVFVVTADGHAELRAVTLGATNDDRAELLSGARAGEVVIVSPPPGLRDGARVSVQGDGR